MRLRIYIAKLHQKNSLLLNITKNVKVVDSLTNSISEISGYTDFLLFQILNQQCPS